MGCNSLKRQINPNQQKIGVLGVPVVEAEEVEADDCIASLAGRFKGELSVVIVGADKDLRQCLDTDVIMWDPSQSREKIISSPRAPRP